jgi:LAO/AO transport system kinase
LKAALKSRYPLEHYVEGVLRGDRIVLGQSITLAESTLPSDQKLAGDLIERIIGYTGNSIRIGITGVPGVGKSTFIESLGKHVTGQKKKLAVLTIDPSSQKTKGSILGDKTRMEELAKNRLAFVRPSASQQALGGIAHKTREAMLLCEAAGYEVIIIETVGVGQSEVAVSTLVDFFLLLMLAGAGDELQGIKKGIMEVADAIVINKADGDNIKKATKAQAEYQHALHLFPPSPSGWKPKVVTASAQEGHGIEAVWQMIGQFMAHARHTGFFAVQRQRQNVAWMHDLFLSLLRHELFSSNEIKQLTDTLEQDVAQQKTSPFHAARTLFEAYRKGLR